MNTYIVHIYREMRLSYADIEADTPEAAAAIARDKPTGDADDIDDCDGQTSAALIDMAGDEDYSQSVTFDFEVERQRKAAPKLLDALRWITCCPMIRGPVGTTAYIVSDERMAQAHAAIAEAENAASPVAVNPAKKPYAVLLLYPDYANDDGSETFYAWVEAPNSLAAVSEAQRQAVATNEWDDVDPADFAPLLVTEGRHHGQPID